ncbi:MULTISPECIES: GNAT family N-acetyltransferase [unclassified Francisella]|uniref:GNAT family N-acetyltransferase n=1 Tax=unclassified Francisella TaxID=2610885 RepID=UPI002E3685FF|nr:MULTISPECIES: GNAT family N-acetyltransferase [unclassified Francisella]MED7819816.1 GNAT family N-acetyltransferase [Francisella sp. 19S2-4]MED7830636.1 GNAT family N-acetyltransferase [Francisella sp. 19S2-10]
MQILKLDNLYFDKIISLIRLSDSSFSWSDQQILDSLDQYLVLGLLDQNELKAVVIFSSIFEVAELLYICVDKFSKNQGLGYTILKESFVLLSKQNIQEVFLEVDINNHIAIKLYSKLGFKKISIRKNYYKKNNGSYSDALIFQLKID